MKFMTVPVVVGALLLAVPTWGQLVTPDITESQFAGGMDEGTQLMLFSPKLPPPNLAISHRYDLTLETHKQGVGVVDNDFDSVDTVSGLTPIGRRSKASPELIFSADFAQDVVYIDESHTQLALHGSLTSPAFRVFWPTGRGSDGQYVGLSVSAYAAHGTTSVYDNIFHIFAATPPFAGDMTTTLFTGGIVRALSDNTTVEAAVDEVVSPGTLSLQSQTEAVRLQLPLGDVGRGGRIAVERRMNSRTGLEGYLDDESLAGNGSVKREQDRAVGFARSDENEEDEGISCRYSSSPTQELTLFLEHRHKTWGTSGVVPNAADLGLSIPFGVVTYGADSDLEVQDYGALWRHEVGAAHRWMVEDQWLELRGHLAATYELNVVVLSQSGSTSLDADRLRGQLVTALYEFPVGRVSNIVDLEQIVPVTESGSGSSSGGSNSTSARSSFGGFSIGWTLSYPM